MGQGLRKSIDAVAVPMIDEDHLGFSLESLQPVDQTVFIRVAADAGQGVDLGINLNRLVEQFHFFRSVYEQTAESSNGLIADKQNHTLRAPEIMFKMMSDPPGIAHAAG